MTDDELRDLLVAPGDLGAARVTKIQARAHDAMRARAPSARTVGRVLELCAIAVVAVAQLAWAWSVVLR